MLTARHVLTATLLIAAFSLVGMGISLWRSMEPSQLGGDSYGTRAHGQRGVFDLLSELKVPVDRSLLPPNGAWDRPTTLVLWGPHRGMVQLEPAYLAQVSRWVQAGGRVVLALSDPNNDELFSFAAPDHDKKRLVFSILEELGLPNVHTELANLDEPADAEDADGLHSGAASSNSSTVHHQETPKPTADTDLFSVRDPKTKTVQVSCGGDLRGWESVVVKLEVPQQALQVLDTSAEKPNGWLKIKTAAGNEKTLVASYRAGKGEILLVGDTELLENGLLAQADNSLLAWRLLVAGDRAVVWDEFYHGLTIRGNPLYLLRRAPFGALMAAILILIAVCIWRQAVRFGPPNVVPPIPRRTLAEYIETMARLFQRGRHSQPFLLAEMRGGMLWTLRSELGLNLGQEKLETISAVLRRKRPERAARLTDAVAAIDLSLEAGSDLSDKETVLTLQRISACL